MIKKSPIDELPEAHRKAALKVKAALAADNKFPSDEFLVANTLKFMASDKRERCEAVCERVRQRMVNVGLDPTDHGPRWEIIFSEELDKEFPRTTPS